MLSAIMLRGIGGVPGGDAGSNSGSGREATAWKRERQVDWSEELTVDMYEGGLEVGGGAGGSWGEALLAMELSGVPIAPAAELMESSVDPEEGRTLGSSIKCEEVEGSSEFEGKLQLGGDRVAARS